MKKKRPTKQEQLILDWKDYNKKNKHYKSLQMTFSEYSAWVLGKSKKARPVKDAEYEYKGRPSWAASTDHIPSVISNSRIELGRNSIVERVAQGKIVGEEADLIIEKAGRIGLSTSKGSYQYITEGTDLRTLGKKTEQL